MTNAKDDFSMSKYSNFILSSDLKNRADAIVEKYETKKASILEILRLVMEEHGHITLAIEEAVAEYLEIPVIDVREVVTFYTLFYTKPKAKHRFHVCRTLSCHLMGSGDIIAYLENQLGVKAGEMTADGQFSIETVECLGACEMAPMMQVNDDQYVGFLSRERVDELIEKVKRNKEK